LTSNLGTEVSAVARRLKGLIRRLIHSFAYFVASGVALAAFFIVLMLAEAVVYTLTGQSVSVWALVLAALAAALFFSPLVHGMQRWIDRMLFPRHLDTLAAIRQLGAGDLADVPLQNVERAVLERICQVSHRLFAALDERELAGGRLHLYPKGAPTIPDSVGSGLGDYDIRLPLPRRTGRAYLYLGPRADGWPTDAQELESLKSLARFAATSLEHARLTHQQAEAARLDSLTRVARQLHSHDLKNRLHDLAFLAHNIESGRLDKEDISQLIGAIRKVVGRMQTLMQRLSDPREKIAPVLSAVDMHEWINRIVQERLWPEGISVSVDLPPMPMIQGDEGLLQSVFENIFDNATQAMQGRGQLLISGRILHPPQSAEDAIEIRIHDNGPGMTDTFISNQLFRLFSTTRPNGLGIGLYLSRRIVDAHGGEIGAESGGEGKGSTFFIRLPMWQVGTTKPPPALQET
jgi:signal transduction histidine kinase